MSALDTCTDKELEERLKTVSQTMQNPSTPERDMWGHLRVQNRILDEMERRLPPIGELEDWD